VFDVRVERRVRMVSWVSAFVTRPRELGENGRKVKEKVSFELKAEREHANEGQRSQPWSSRE
jgi:hypothetical protein